MWRSWRCLVCSCGFLLSMALAARSSGGDAKTFQGEIVDSQCALNVHSLSRSHKEMMAMKPEIKSNLECARYCVKERGGKFVLLSKEKVYKLDAQTLAEPWVGLKVKVLGTLDPKTELITVESISPQGAIPGTRPRAH